MWILPRQLHTSASALDTEGSISDLNDACQLCEQSLLWRSKPSPSRTWSQRWKRVNWMRHLSGRILKPATGKSFVTEWISSAVDIRVSRSQQQGSEKEKKTRDTSGHLYRGQLGLFDQDTASLRMSKDILPSALKTSATTWESWVTSLRQEYSVRLSAAHLTREKEFLSSGGESTNWVTQNARDWKDSVTKVVGDRKDGKKREDQLPRQIAALSQWPTPTALEGQDQGTNWKTLARLDKGGRILRRIASLEEKNWPTPTSAEGSKIPDQANCGQVGLSNHPSIVGLPDREKLNKSGKSQESWATPKASGPEHAVPNMRGSKGDQPLPAQVQNWPTPDTQNHRDGSKRRKDSYGSHGVSLHHKIAETENWATPNAGDGKAGMAEGRKQKSLGQDVSQQQGGYRPSMKLNPNWVEQLMGLPVGWTQLPTAWIG